MPERHHTCTISQRCVCLCAWLIQSGGARPDGGLDEKATGHVRQTSVGDTNAAKGKIWQLEIKSTAYPPIKRQDARLGCVRTEPDSLASA